MHFDRQIVCVCVFEITPENDVTMQCNKLNCIVDLIKTTCYTIHRLLIQLFEKHIFHFLDMIVHVFAINFN